MKLGTWARWAVFLVVLGWIGYTVAGMGWSYFTVQELVDTALRDASDRHRAAFAAGSQIAVDSLTSSVRSGILLGALHEGIGIDAGDVGVSANSVGLSAVVRWNYPVVRYGRDEVLVVPMSVSRSLAVAP
jgi:hypothetical protein